MDEILKSGNFADESGYTHSSAALSCSLVQALEGRPLLNSVATGGGPCYYLGSLLCLGLPTIAATCSTRPSLVQRLCSPGHSWYRHSMALGRANLEALKEDYDKLKAEEEQSELGGDVKVCFLYLHATGKAATGSTDALSSTASVSLALCTSLIKKLACTACGQPPKRERAGV